MATKRVIEATSLKLGVTTGMDDNGDPVFAEKRLATVSPALTDAEALSVGGTLGDLQAYNVTDVYRVDTCRLSAE